MEYYIMGSAENAERIRKSFAAHGYNVGNLDCSDSGCMYYTIDTGAVICTHHPIDFHIIRTHQGYQPLPL